MAEQVCETAMGQFANGYNCCQSVLMALCADYGLDAELAARLATGFGVGMARGGVCGAVSGGVLVLGLAGGGGGAAKTATYTRARDFYARFIALHGSMLCRDLIGLDPSTPDGLARAREEQRFQTVCSGLVRDAVSLVREILDSGRLGE